MYYSDLKPYYTVKDEEDETLVFESRFESGNLRKVMQTTIYEYDLLIRPDFRVGNYT